MTRWPCPCVPSHASLLAGIHAAAFPRGEHWSADALGVQLAMPGVFGFLAEPGGFILARVAADEAEILTLAVVPEARRQGLARALLDATHPMAARLGAAALFLEVAESNLAGRALYRATGYEEVGRRRDYYVGGGDALVLRRALLSSDLHVQGFCA